MLEELKTLCSLDGISGRENDVREYIISQIGEYADYSVDAMGNLLVFKKGKNRPKNKVMLAAHMDEVGLIITYINEDGFLKFSPVGGVDTKVLLGRSVIISGNVFGVVGIKPVHLLKPDEKKQIPKRIAFISISVQSQKKMQQSTSALAM